MRFLVFTRARQFEVCVAALRSEQFNCSSSEFWRRSIRQYGQATSGYH